MAPYPMNRPMFEQTDRDCSTHETTRPQHAAMHRSGEHATSSPRKSAAAHAAWVVTEQVPPPLAQHAPWQLVVRHELPAPTYTAEVLIAAHTGAVVTEQTLPWQHPPAWVGHGLGEHVEPPPRYAPLHGLEENTRTQPAPGFVQQAPEIPTHGSGEQTVRRPWNWPVAAH